MDSCSRIFPRILAASRGVAPCHLTPSVCGRFPNARLQRGTCKAHSRRKTEPRYCFGREEGRKEGENESTPLSVIPGREPGGQSRGGSELVQLRGCSSPGEEGPGGEGAVFFFCPNNLIKFVSAASGKEISSRYAVCLCLINVNLPRAPAMPQALRCLALHQRAAKPPHAAGRERKKHHFCFSLCRKTTSFDCNIWGRGI